MFPIDRNGSCEPCARQLGTPHGRLPEGTCAVSSPLLTAADLALPAMLFPRAAGMLLHPTSLPGDGGIGDFGPDAHRFVQWLAEAGLRVWQVLPLGPTGYGDSPYQCFSAFAGNPLLIHVPGFSGTFPAHTVDFGAVIPAKQAALAAWLDALPYDDHVRHFVDAQRYWLTDYALFMALKQAHGGVAWPEWETGAMQRDPAALARWSDLLRPEIERIHKEQHQFFLQYRALREACRAHGIRLMGDIPVYVAHDSSDVWANRSLFQLHDDGSLQVQAGVPPDYFSETGQLWGNPLYDWPLMEADGFSWWIERMRAGLELFDLVRLDHFRGFAAYWEVPGDALTAVNGRWVNGPGTALFDALTGALGPLPIVAENLGLITPDVEVLRERFGYPGMAILQFAFDGEGSNFIPHRFERELVVYTGTHDNDTTMGWWQSTGEDDSTRSADAVAREKAFARRYLATDGHDMHWVLIRAALASVANTVLVPLQDVLGLGSEARMNTPGRQGDNWRFRFAWEQLTPEITQRLRALTSTYER
jgi:4-alpha-glucanotransferase